MTSDPTSPTTGPPPGRRTDPVDTARANGQPAPPAGDPPATRAVAAFDFDGTLSRRDTMVPFLVRIAGWPRLLLTTAKALRRTRRRDEVKVAVVGDLVRGMRADELGDHGRAYAATLADGLRPESVERLRWHQSEGHVVVLVSAGLEVYLRPVADELGVDDVLGVALLADDAGLVTGAVDGGLNNRGPQKVARLRAWLDDRFGRNATVELWAYGDSSGDEELLAYADHPTWVGRRARRNESHRDQSRR